MEEKKIRMRDLTLDDMEGVKTDGNWSMIDILRSVTKRAAEIFDNEVVLGQSYRGEEKGDEKPSSSGSKRFSHKEKGNPSIVEKPSSSKSTKFSQKEKGKLSVEENPNSCKNIKFRFSFHEEISCSENLLKKPIKCRKDQRLREEKSFKKTIEYKGIVQHEEEWSKKCFNKLFQSNLKSTASGFVAETSGMKKRKKSMSKSCSSGEEDQVKKKRSKIDHGPEPPPPLPEEFRNAIQELAEGRNISAEMLVLQKGLYNSDVDRHQSRFSIPRNSMIGDFLKDEEKANLLRRLGNGRLEPMRVSIIDPLLIKDTVDLRRWPMKKDSGNESVSYMITGNWTEILKRNNFESGCGTVVQLWSFRIEEELCFCLVRLPGN
ncbi:Uncharacterized protein Adt_36885 [Abeliophyllum distichum]|uniref:B3 domain-containing protein n=1 Tax=Abeliophyllum distichum TaxID=126358 RepID=A0ABD1QIU3_9LAMI